MQKTALLWLFAASNWLAVSNAKPQTANPISDALQQIQQHHAYLNQAPIDLTCLTKNYTWQPDESPAHTLSKLELLMLEFADNHMHLNTNTPDSYRLYGPVTVAWHQGHFVISDFWQNQLQDPMGLFAGAKLLRINDLNPQQVIDQFPTRCLDKSQPKNQTWVLNKALAGIYSQPRIITIQLGDQRRTIDLDALTFQTNDGLLAHHVKDGIGIIQIHNSLGQTGLIKAFDQAIDQLHGSRGLVLDLRHTIGGGDSYLARAIIGRLIDRAQPYQTHRFVEQHDGAVGVPRIWTEWVEPRGITYQQPVVVLVNHWTGSMGEGLAIGLQGMQRATVMGTAMAGLLGAVDGFPINGVGYGFQMPVEQLFHVNGTRRERAQPDIVIKPDGNPGDNVMDAAIKHLKTQTQRPAQSSNDS